MINNWGRKLTSIALAVVIWLSVNHSLTVTKMLDGISVRLINIPSGMTIEGLEQNGILSTKVSLSIQGDKRQLAEITNSDLEIVLDATGKSGDWHAPITRKNLNSVNPAIDLSKAIKRVSNQQLPISFTKLVSQKIPVYISPPIGQVPRNYQFLDVWPDHLTMTVSGPEEAVLQLKAKGVSLGFNLSDIDPAELDAIQSKEADTIEFPIPDAWKQVVIPTLSDRPFSIDDVAAADLCIDFVRSDLHPITKPIPITLFFSPETSHSLNPEKLSLATSALVSHVHGIYLLKSNLWAKGVSRLFVELVQEMLEITILVKPNGRLEWSLQFLAPRTLEDKYVSLLMSDEEDLAADPILMGQREDHLRERFRRYMTQFQLYKTKQDKLDLNLAIEGSKVVVNE
jgi:hypothetical protein